MSESFRVSGSRHELPQAAAWKLTPRPGGWILAEDGQGRRVRFMISESAGSLGIAIAGRILHGRIEAASRQEAGGGSGDTDLVAQFPGKVRKLLVQEGSIVKEGEVLLLVEAMKMEFSVKAGSAGRVARIHVKEGQQLSPGDRFLDLEGESGGG
jgi:3-methylcrotonyl-CoA carboxylase alpha subunit